MSGGAPTPMSRRDAVRAAGLIASGAVIASSGVLAACAREPDEPRAGPGAAALSADDEALVEAIADTLLPSTAASPGARAAGAGAAINLLLTDCYAAAARQRVVRGLRDFRATCRASCGAAFAALSAAERERVLRLVDAEAERMGDAHYFALVRELALRAYFSSEIGMTRALRYVPVPGRWVGCVALTPGQPAWG